MSYSLLRVSAEEQTIQFLKLYTVIAEKRKFRIEFKYMFYVTTDACRK